MIAQGGRSLGGDYYCRKSCAALSGCIIYGLYTLPPPYFENRQCPKSASRAKKKRKGKNLRQYNKNAAKSDSYWKRRWDGQGVKRGVKMWIIWRQHQNVLKNNEDGRLLERNIVALKKRNFNFLAHFFPTEGFQNNTINERCIEEKKI